MSVLAIILFVSSPALAAGSHLQNISNISGATKKSTYTNPLSIQIPNDGLVESCAAPPIRRGRTDGDANWDLSCTTAPLNGNDKT